MEKLKKYFLLVFLLVLIIPTQVFAKNPYPTTQTFNGEKSVPCTYVAWQQVHDRLGISLPSWGNAVNWYLNAKNAGYAVGTVPKKDSIAVYSGWYGYGHVAYILDVYEDCMLAIEGGSGTISTYKTSFEIGSGQGIYLIGFIYLDNIPKSTTTTKKANPNNTTTKNIKSENSFLKSLTIDEIILVFDKETFTYNLTVPYELTEITISGEAEDSKSSVTGFGVYSLEVGDNNIPIKVIAEDKSSSEYVINIMRTDKFDDVIISNEDEDADNDEEEKNTTDKKNYMLFITLGSITLLILIFFFIKHKNKIKGK